MESVHSTAPDQTRWESMSLIEIAETAASGNVREGKWNCQRHSGGATIIFGSINLPKIKYLMWYPWYGLTRARDCCHSPHPPSNPKQNFSAAAMRPFTECHRFPNGKRWSFVSRQSTHTVERASRVASNGIATPNQQTTPNDNNKCMRILKNIRNQCKKVIKEWCIIQMPADKVILNEKFRELSRLTNFCYHYFIQGLMISKLGKCISASMEKKINNFGRRFGILCMRSAKDLLFNILKRMVDFERVHHHGSLVAVC